MKIRVFLFVVVVSLVGVVGCEKKDGEEFGEEAGAEQVEKKGAEEGAEEQGAAEKEGEDEEAAETEGVGEQADRRVTCESVVTNVVTVLTDARGNQAFFQKDDIPGLTEACKKAGTLEKSPETAGCLHKVDGVEAMLACEGSQHAMKTWADNEASEDEEGGEEPKE